MEQNGANPTRLMPSRTLILYYAMFVMTIVIAVIGFVSGNTGDLILTIPIALILLKTIITDKSFIHIPPMMIFLMMGTFLFAICGKLASDGNTIGFIASVLTGMNLEIIGLISVYILMKSMPGVREEKRRMVLLISLSISMAIFVVMKMLQYYTSLVVDLVDSVYIDVMMEEMLGVILGGLIIGFFYNYTKNASIFRYTVDNFLENNSKTLGITDREVQDIENLILQGESDKLEFKSTIRTNLQTGEPDKRMEKAVLKTLVAFMNSEGGTLLIGVSDDGTVCGIDLDGFDNRDKLNLHFTNMISSSIGNEYLPYIKFKLVDFDEKRSVMRVVCARSRKPVFLKEGKAEIFFVRSGPSSVELAGMNLINYVKNRSLKGRKTVLEKVSE